MVKYRKNQLIEIVTMLENTNQFMQDISKIEQSVLQDALAQCQETAIEIGTDLETRGEKGQALVKILEAYCENLYEQSTVLNDAEQCKKIAEKIKNQLARLISGIQNELPKDKKEVVFLPYTATMWDSLESVWMAARDDENCDAVVVPIPYFDKNADGSLGQMHYEGDRYPDYVPITSWQEYDIAARRPDAVYIHNPYDECNYVTSVHPAFYASKLKDYTDKLIYIPYFVLSEIDPSNQAAIDGMKHFCFLPGTIYADQVIVQSENIRQIYINEFLKEAEKIHFPVTRAQLEKRILGLGSPKFDKVLNTKKEDLEIPAEWLKVIERPDGSRKKIIFYNTSVAAFLANDEKMLAKMEDVFRIFQERQDDVALLWRPHPLMQNTIKSMRLELWEKYSEMVERYKADGWGIYDDTADMDRAVCLSDAYYGDRSSIVELYRSKKKVVLIQTLQSLS